MEQPNTKIKFYARRSFSEKMNASFDFIKQNWKPLLKYSTYLILPLCVIQAFALNKLTTSSFLISELSDTMGGYLDNESAAGFVLHYMSFILLAVIGSMLMTATVFAVIQVYNESDDELKGLTFERLKPCLFRNLKRYLIAVLFMTLILFVYSFVVAGLGIASLYTMLITVPAIFILAVPLTLLVPIYLFEKISIGKAFAKSFKLGFPTWGGIFGISLIMGFISSILSGIMALPWYVVTMVKYIFGMSDAGGEVAMSGGYNMFLYALGILSTYGGYISMIFLIVGLSYQYAHASEKVNSVSVVDDIDNFEQF